MTTRLKTPDETIDIDTTGWQEIPCDKCGSICSYATGAENDGCFGCFMKENPNGVDPK